jgi:hypothetical protein
LLLVRAAVARDLGFHRGRWIGKDGQACLGAGQEDHAADVPEDEGRPGVDGMDDVLDRETVRMEARDESGHTFVDPVEALGEREPGRWDERAALDEPVVAAVRVDGAISRADRTGVDAEDAHGSIAPSVGGILGEAASSAPI